jgi:hypothetical protein
MYPSSVSEDTGIISYEGDTKRRAETARRRRQLTRAIKESLRELSNQLSLLNRHVSAHIDLNDTDLDCLELINRHGPLNPSALARRAGLHPATLTGIWTGLNAAAGSPASATPATAAPSSSAPCATATPSCSASRRG